MNSYLVLSKDREYKIINDQINWLALLFGNLWFLYHKMWTSFLTSVVVLLMLNLYGLGYLQVIINIAISYFARDFLLIQYKCEQFIPYTIIRAYSLEEARNKINYTQ